MQMNRETAYLFNDATKWRMTRIIYFPSQIGIKKTDVASAFPLELAFSSGDGNGLGLVGFLI